MPNQTFKLTGRAFLLGVIAAAYPVVGQTAPAARVDFAIGNVQVLGPNGQSRTAAKGAQIEQGETISTNNGRAQLRFTDGAYVSLQPESEFRIDQYRYDGKQDGNEKGFFSLVKGGLRTITGLVGRNNKNNYQVTTSVATIGIRGTEYTIQYGQSVTGTVGEGEINVCNGAGCLSVTNGESYYVQNDGVKPVLTNKRTDLPPPSPQNPPSTFAEGETVNENGDPCTLFPASCGVGSMLTGSQTVNLALSGGGEASFNTTVQFNDSGALTEALGTTYLNSSSSGNDGIIAWGTAFYDSGGEGLFVKHYVAGTPVPDVGALSGMVGTYAFAGATTPTNFQGGGMTDGQGNPLSVALTGGGVSANFSNGDISGSLNWKVGSGSLNGVFTGSMVGSGQGFSASGHTTTNSVSSLSVNGIFAGDSAAKLGLVYSLNDSAAINDTMYGAAVMNRTSLNPAPPPPD